MKILIVSDDENKAKEISSKLLFLRNNDKVIISDYMNYKRDMTACRAEIVLVHLNHKQAVSVIKYFKKNQMLTIILVPKMYDSEFILSCFDLGIDDFILEDADNFEFVVRIIKHIKYNSAKISAFRNVSLLEQENIIDKSSGFYTQNNAQKAISNTMDNELITQGSYITLSASKNDLENFSLDKLVKAVKSTLRSTDIAVQDKNTQISFLMPYTDMNGALVVFNRIKDQLDFKIHAGISDICGFDFSDFEKHAHQALSEANATNSEYVLYQEDEKTLDNWLSDTQHKGYKIFRQIFNKKLEKVITPVFYRIQQSYEAELSDTEIKQEVNEDKCSIKFSSGEHESTLSVIYSGFSSVVISIMHKGLNSPENKDIKLQLSEVTEKELVSIIEDFVNEFKNQSTDL